SRWISSSKPMSWNETSRTAQRACTASTNASTGALRKPASTSSFERTKTMKAIVHVAYGPAEKVLELREIDVPTPRSDEVLVRVRAASVHPDVWHVIEGFPYVVRLFGNGVAKPKKLVPGTDLAGVVEAVGDRVSRFKVGDEVFGESTPIGWWNGGAYA